MPAGAPFPPDIRAIGGSLDEIGPRIRVSREQILRIERYALRKLAAELERRGLELADLVPDHDPRAPGALHVAESPRHETRAEADKRRRAAREKRAAAA
jgi:hypothetical protein